MATALCQRKSLDGKNLSGLLRYCVLKTGESWDIHTSRDSRGKLVVLSVSQAFSWHSSVANISRTSEKFIRERQQHANENEEVWDAGVSRNAHGGRRPV